MEAFSLQSAECKNLLPMVNGTHKSVSSDSGSAHHLKSWQRPPLTTSSSVTSIAVCRGLWINKQCSMAARNTSNAPWKEGSQLILAHSFLKLQNEVLEFIKCTAVHSPGEQWRYWLISKFLQIGLRVRCVSMYEGVYLNYASSGRISSLLRLGF